MYALPCLSTSTPIPSGTDLPSSLVPHVLTSQFSFHQDYPDSLVRLQNEHWNPLLYWARCTFNIELLTSQSVLFSAQPEATKKNLDEALQKLDSWQMAGCVSFLNLCHVMRSTHSKSRTAVERATYTTKSFIIALALVHGRITAEQAALASQVELASQIERWGEVEDCTSFTFVFDKT